MRWNFCPNCGHRVYHHNERGCEHVETTAHVVKVDETGWTLKHPVAEREADKLFDCKIHGELTDLDEYLFPEQPGEYSIIENGNGGWSFEPAEKGRTQCECDVALTRLGAGL